MAFFTEARDDGTIDKRIEMSQHELKMMMLGMLEDSNAWEMHKAKDHNARIVPAFKEDLSEFENHVNKHSKKAEEQNEIQYNKEIKMFTAQCQCGEKFKIDIKNDKVESADPSLKMKDLDPYRKNNNSEQQYGRGKEGSDNDNNYNNNPARQPSLSYNNSSGGMTYKN